MAKIYNQNARILSRIETIISNQQALKSRITKIEEAMEARNNKNNDNSTIDMDFIQVNQNEKLIQNFA